VEIKERKEERNRGEENRTEEEYSIRYNSNV
jgi:hypothetical protein